MKGILKWLFITAGIFYVLTLLIGEALPPLVRTFIISRASEAGLQVGALTIQDIGFSKMELRDIEIGDPMKPAISIASVSIDYSLFGLLGGTAERIIVSGANIHPHELAPMPEGGSREAGPPGFAVSRLQVLSSEVDVALPGGMITVPVEVDLRREAESHLYTVAARALPFGEAWICDGAIDAASGDGQFNINAFAFRLQRWTDLFMVGSEFILPSPAEAAIDVRLSGWRLHHAAIKGNATIFDIVFPPYSASASWNVSGGVSSSWRPKDLEATIVFQSIEGPEFEINQPFKIKISGESLDRLTVTTNDISIFKPLPVMIREIDGIVAGAEKPMTFKGRYAIECPPRSLASLQPSLRADRPLAATGDLVFTLPPLESPWQVEGTLRQRLAVAGEQITSSLNRLAIDYSIGGQGENAEARILLDAAGLRATMTNLSLSGKRIGVKAAMTNGAEGWKSSGDLKLEGIDAGIGEQITIKNFSAMIPFQSRLKSKHRITQTGSFNADAVDIAGLLLKNLVGELGVGPGVMSASGQAVLPVEQLIVTYNAEHMAVPGLDSYFLNFEVPSATLPEKTSLAPLHPLLEGIDASGTIACRGRIEGIGDMFTGTGELNLKDFHLAMTKAGITMAGIEGIIRFRDLPALLSEPAQELTIRELDIQGIPFRDGRLQFTGEGLGSVLVERGEFELLGGKVFFGGVRIGSDGADIDTVLYCDRIDFDRLLNVLVGETIASGDAEINGVIPIKLSAEGPLFKEGFLFSSPGIQGALQIQDASLISGGMVLVEEAVRDFNYEWVRVKLNSKNNRLDMSVILKGVPAHKLPLEYDSKKKDFVRSKTGKRMVTLKGLTLELKFLDIDLERLLKEGGRVKVMADKKQ